MGFGEMIKGWREKKGWTQRDLASAVGCTDGYIAHLENEQKLPSLAICMAISGALELSEKQQNDLLNAIDTARYKTTEDRIRTRGFAVRGALRTRGAIYRPETESSGSTPTPEEIARDLSVDKDLGVAYMNLKIALNDPEIREAVLKTLSSFAQTARK